MLRSVGPCSIGSDQNTPLLVQATHLGFRGRFVARLRGSELGFERVLASFWRGWRPSEGFRRVSWTLTLMHPKGYHIRRERERDRERQRERERETERHRDTETERQRLVKESLGFLPSPPPQVSELCTFSWRVSVDKGNQRVIADDPDTFTHMVVAQSFGIAND